MILEARDISFSYERKGAELFSNINDLAASGKGCESQTENGKYFV